jgi:Fe-S-cluster containining protein
MDTKFLCSGCGACCMMAGTTGKVPSKEDGSCIHLTKENKCEIYGERPLICDVSKMYKEHIKNGSIPKDTTRKEHYKETTLICHELIDMFKLSDKFKINIDEYDKEEDNI